MKKRLLSSVFTIFTVPAILILFSGKANALSGSSFKADRIADDSIFYNGFRMGVPEIQAFLNAKVPTCDTNGTKTYGSQTRAEYGTSVGHPPPYVCLRDYTQTFPTIAADQYCSAVAGGTRTAADIIAAVSQACGINPQAMLVTLQKESAGPLVVDDWPFATQYVTAMGFGCPDTALGTDVDANQNGCYDQYEGFYKQMYYAARQFKRYIVLKDVYNFAIGRTSFVGYNPNSACGGTNITPLTQATAALYNYTPYQPNAAALANLYGTGDSCSAYGNRNFWRIFNDWFGPTLTNEFIVAIADNGDPTQWVIENGRRYVIPDTDTKVAWGLSPSWDEPFVFNGSYLSTLPVQSTLTRIARPAGDSGVYFVDSGKKYKFTSVESLKAWGYNTGNIVDTPAALSANASTQGNMTHTVSVSGSSSIYLMDGGTLRHILDPNVLAAWAGDGGNNIPVSNAYFNSKSQGTDITGIKVTTGAPGATEYMVVSGQKLALSVNVAQLYPGVAQTVSVATINRLKTSSSASQFIRASNSQTIYMVDNSEKHAVGSPELVRAWGKGVSPSVNIVTQGNVNLLADGTALNTYLADVGGQLYVMDGRKIIVPSGLDSAYRKSGKVFTATQALLDLAPVGETASNFLKGFNSPKVFLMDEAVLRNVTTPNQFSLWSTNQTITSVSDYVLNTYGSPGSAIGAFVNDGTNDYLIESGKKHVIDNSTKSNWQLNSPSVLSSTTLGRFTTGASVSNNLKYGSFKALVHEGKAFITVDNNIAQVWGISNPTDVNEALVKEFLQKKTMTRFAKSNQNNDTRLFIVDGGDLYHLTPNHAANLGLTASQTVMSVNPEAITPSISLWQDVLVKDSSNKMYIIDGGIKRPFADTATQNAWTNNGSILATQVTNGFLNLLPNGSAISKSIKGSSPSIYASENMTKKWIQSWGTYQNSYAPYTAVNDYLINILPSGSNIP